MCEVGYELSIRLKKHKKRGLLLINLKTTLRVIRFPKFPNCYKLIEAYTLVRANHSVLIDFSGRGTKNTPLVLYNTFLLITYCVDV